MFFGKALVWRIFVGSRALVVLLVIVMMVVISFCSSVFPGIKILDNLFPCLKRSKILDPSIPPRRISYPSGGKWMSLL